MKRIIAFLIVVTMILTMLVGCKKDESDGSSTAGDTDISFKIPDGLSGTDIIKLLLASRRLDSQLLKNEGDLFESGSAVMQTLAERASANLPASYLAETSEAPRGGKLTLDGDLFSWSDFPENCNSYDYFENITQNIISCAMQGATLIDDTKRLVRVLDKWVSVGASQYYLGVSEDSEIIFSREEDLIRICRRYKNDSGENVYEMYFSGDGFESRMLYVPGMRYEWSEKISESEGTYFVADNSKGYWETLVIGETPDHYNVSCFVMKNDICYDAAYDASTGEISILRIISSDRATDILSVTDFSDSSLITLNLGAFDGIGSVEIVAGEGKTAPTFGESTDETTVIYSSEGEIYATTTGVDSATLNLVNGGKIEYGVQYAGSSVMAGRVLVSYGSEVYTGMLELTVSGSTYGERLANLKEFLNEVGLECRRDTDTVLSGIERASTETDSTLKYYRWHGFSIKTEGNIASALSVEDTIFDTLRASYSEIKDTEVIDFTDKETLELNIDFSPVSVTSLTGAVFENMSAEIIGLVLNVSDTTLFVENASYTIGFALVEENSANVIHIPVESPTETVYTRGESFTLGTAHARLLIPTLSEGRYTLVAYAATSDKIRASQYVPIAFTSISTEEAHLSGAVLVPAAKENGELLLTFIDSRNIEIELQKGDVMNYSELFGALSEKAGEFGVISDDLLEIYDEENDRFITCTDTESPLVNGTYRLSYNSTDGENEIVGYVYAEYTAQK